MVLLSKVLCGAKNGSYMALMFWNQEMTDFVLMLSSLHMCFF